jgi:alkanesulfonate monooxygenase SsuD/methylene tetrahydromethanopterin reductase-like flavin-dependent oxidoreductase (luciferase family)
VIRVGLTLLPEVNPPEDERWRRVEELGFAHAWCFDHLAWRTLADSPWHATVPTLAAAAMMTSTIPLGTFVATPNFRHPVPFSRELMTLDAMSGGRLIVGLGAGGPGFDADVLGGAELPPRERHARYAEFVGLLDLLLRQPRTSWTGEYFSAVDARTVPGPVQRPHPPFVVAANGPRGFELALRYGTGWVTMGSAPRGSDVETWWRGVADAAGRFEEAVERVGAPGAALDRYLDVMAGAGPAGSVEKITDDIGRAAQLGFTDFVLAWPRAEEPFAGEVAVFEEIAGRLVDGAITP